MRQATWTELLSTGRLGLIRGAELRRSLGQYYGTADNRWTGFDQMDRELASIKASIEQALEPETRRAVNGFGGAPITQADADMVFEELRGNREFRASLVAAEERHLNISRSSQASLEDATSLLSIIRSYDF